LAVILWHNKVGLLDILRIDFTGLYELADIDGVLRGNPQVLKLAGFDDDVFAFAMLVALYDLILMLRCLLKFMKWTFGGGVKLPGRVTRREDEVALFTNPSIKVS
jgi:hypothetical protein